MDAQRKPLVIWLIFDGKPGHLNQSLGLVEAITRITDTHVVRLPPLPFWKTLKGKLLHKNFSLNIAAKPDLIIGAGHATHLTLILLSWLYKAKSVVLMKPSLPRWLFGLCIVPEHDGATTSGNIIATKGVLNRIMPAEKKLVNKGMILIGGPSVHYDWDESEIISQVKQIISGMSHINWTIADSRRTPEQTTAALKLLTNEKVQFLKHSEVDSTWLPDQLADAAYAWVSEDSVSMVYEALTTKAHVGLISAPEKRVNRVAQGVSKLVEEGYLITFRQWHEGKELGNSISLNSEADRCATAMLKQWLVSA